MQRSEQRILTTHVGSLIRPAEVLDAAGEAAKDGGREARLARAVDEVVRQQIDVGLDVVNDGEFGKIGWSTYFRERVTGFEVRDVQRKPLFWLGRDRERFREFFAEEMPEALEGAPAEVCTGPIRYRDRSAIDRDLRNLRHAVEAAPAQPTELFYTVVAPASAVYNGVNEYYATDRDYVFALADALREEYRAVHEAGFVLQVDDAVLANMYDTLAQEDPRRYREWAEIRVAALNHALAGIPPERVRYHICFGSWHVPHVADAPFAEIVDLMLQVNAQAYSIEAANVRHEHEWRVWERARLPPNKLLLPGVVTHHTTVVEHPRLVADRIVRFAKLVGRENVIASTDCGFAQSQRTRRVHPSVMWAKLEALVEGARIATDELY